MSENEFTFKIFCQSNEMNCATLTMPSNASLSRILFAKQLQMNSDPEEPENDVICIIMSLS